MKAIPITYKGIKFRSTLEARWAAFFDRHGWDYLYESYTFDGYIPDFWLIGKRPCFVEIKGITPPYEITDQVQTVMDKIDRAIPMDKFDILLLGGGPYEDGWGGPPTVGWAREGVGWAEDWYELCWTREGFISQEGWYRSFPLGISEKPSNPPDVNPFQFWNQLNNDTRWNP
jgi:hypothetical protein